MVHMFATCLFCNGALGANETLEHFPVGRRLAYDGATGRLWAVCPTCERWNLSPLETRWEAIDEAERAFRATKMRVATDNIGLAKLVDGTELVRVGAPPQLEFAAWRYGDQFGRRRRKMLLYGAAFGSLGLASAGATFVSVLAGVAVSGMAGSALSLMATGVNLFNLKRARRVPTVSVRGNTGEWLRLTRANVALTKVLPAARGNDWALEVVHVNTQPASGPFKLLGYRELAESNNAPQLLTGDVAVRALATMIPSVNADGGNAKRVRSAVELINASTSVGQMMRIAPAHDGVTHDYVKFGSQGVALHQLSPPLRLALEMSLHEGDERRAMEGELHELEARWRDADAIAKIADEMFLPADMNARMNALHKPTQYE